MSDKISVILVDADDGLREVLKGQAKEIDVVADVQGIDEWHLNVQSKRPNILMVELNASGDFSKTLKGIERMKTEFPDTVVFVTSVSRSPEVIISAMRAGAQEFLGKPINQHELGKALERVKRKLEQSRAKGGPGGRIITIFSKKGGVGTTTLAVNLAVALSQASGKKAAIVDLDLQLGDVTSFLDLRPAYNILDACGHDGIVDPAKLQSAMTHHASGVFVLGEPKHPAESEEISASHIGQILTQLRATYAYVVVDTSHIFDSKTLAALDISDNILVTTVSNIASIRATKKVLGVFKDLGFDRDKVRVVVNRINKSDSIKTDKVQKIFDYPVFWTIPNNYTAVIDSINAGIPLIGQKKISNVGKSIQELAETIVKWNHVPASEPKD